MASYRLSDKALADLDGIFEYGVLTFGLRQADKYYDELVGYFQEIANSPLSHPAVNEIRADYRRAVYYAHSVYFRVGPNEVVIVRILGQQDPTKAF